MEFQFTPITFDDVKAIDSWDYQGYVEQVWMGPYFESYEETGELKGPGGFEGFAARVNDELVGLYEFYPSGHVLQIGLALKPDRIGKGTGEPFVRQGIEFGIQHYGGEFDEIYLEVDSGNKAAIRVYEKVGFKIIREGKKEIEMKMECS